MPKEVPLSSVVDLEMESSGSIFWGSWEWRNESKVENGPSGVLRRLLPVKMFWSVRLFSTSSDETLIEGKVNSTPSVKFPVKAILESFLCFLL